MAHNLTESDLYTSPIEVPDNTDSGTNRAGDVENITQIVIDRTHHLNIHSAKKDEANTFTAGPQTIDFLSAGDPVIRVTKSAHDHPGSSSNRWKLIHDWTLSDGCHVRWYSGEGDFGDQSTWCVSTNAIWDPHPAAQNWTKDNLGKESNVLRSEYGELFWYGRVSGGSPWNDNEWDDQGRGNLNVGDTISTTNLNASGDIQVGDDIDAGGDIFAGDDVIAADEFLYASPHNRVIVIPYQSCISAGGGFLTNVPGSFTLPPNSRAEYPLNLPRGAGIGQIRVLIATAVSADWSFSLEKATGFNFGSPTFASVSTINGTSGTLGAGQDNPTINGGGYTVAANETYWVYVGNAGSSSTELLLGGIEVQFSDFGPRNY